MQSTDHRLTSASGVLLLGEAESQLGLIESIADNINDPRRQDRIRYALTKLLRVTVEAAYIKNSELAVVPLRSDLAARLAGHLANIKPATLSFERKSAMA